MTEGGALIDRPLRSVFIGNVPYDITEERLREIFSEVGPVLNMKLVYDRESGKPKGYGFCEYKDIETALSAMRNLNGYEINGRVLRVDHAGSSDRARFNMPPPEMGGGERRDRDDFHGFMSREMEMHMPPAGPEKTPEVISKAVASLPPEQMFELMRQMKACIQNNPNEARTMLLQNPQLAYALLQAQVVMKIIDPAAALAMLHQDNGVPVGTLVPEGQIGSMGSTMSNNMGNNMGGSRSGSGLLAPPPRPPPPHFHHNNTENPWITAASAPPPPPQLQQPTSFNNNPADLDFRQMHDPRMRAAQNNPSMQQDMDLRSERSGAGDPRTRDRDMRSDMRSDIRNDMRSDRGGVSRGDSDLRGDRDLRDPRGGGVPNDPRARARGERDKGVAPPSLPPNMSMGGGFGPGTTDTEKAALIMEVLRLSDEQISALPLEQRQSILALKEQIAKAGNR